MTLNDWKLFRPYIERYKRCGTAEQVTAMQETIIKELEDSYEQSRQERKKRARLSGSLC